jgi:hypothetical protein
MPSDTLLTIGVTEVPVWRARDRRNGVAKFATVTLIIGLLLGTSKADRAGGQFGFLIRTSQVLRVP